MLVVYLIKKRGLKMVLVNLSMMRLSFRHLIRLVFGRQIELESNVYIMLELGEKKKIKHRYIH